MNILGTSKKVFIGEIMSGKILCRKGRKGYAWKCLPLTSPWIPAFMEEWEAAVYIKKMEDAETPSVFISSAGRGLNAKDWKAFCIPQRKARTCF